MKIWFVHQNFPGQYKHLAQHFAADTKNEVVTIGEVTRLQVPGAKQFTYNKPTGASASTHQYIRGLESSVRRGQESARLALKLKSQGLSPDIICSHPGWGDTLYFQDVFPDAKFLSYFEFYYRSRGSDVGFDAEYSKVDLDDMARVRTKNALNLLTLEMADWGICPTRWQHQQFPEQFKSRISVIHDGIDTDLVKPNPNAHITLARDKLKLTRDDEVITYVARNLEPYRGFHIFMRALPRILKERPNARVLLIGGDEVSYGKALPQGQTYRETFLKELGGQIDMSRVHFLGRLPYDQFVNVLQISSAHVYLTYPFVLSWSMLEAMSIGCQIIGSKTQPVEELIEHEKTGLLFDFFSPEELVRTLCDALENKERARELSENARRHIVENYDLKTICLPQHVSLIEQVATGSLPPTLGSQ